MYKLAIFDFDGTLVDSAPGIIDVMYQVAREYEFSMEITEQWKDLIGVPLPHQVEIILPGHHSEYHKEIADRYRQIYDANSVTLCPPFPSLFKMLDSLKLARITTTIASSKRRDIVEPVLHHHQIRNFFDLVIGAQDVSQHKPHPESVHNTLEKLNILPEEAVVIGDSRYDLEMARNAGVDAIGVTTGIHSREVLLESKPISVVDNLDQVLEIILRGRQKQASQQVA